MPESNCKDYTGITREALEKWREQAARSGAPVATGDSFTIEKSGVKMSVEYHEATQVLKMCIVEKPGFIPESMIWSMVEATMGQ